jgi:hypothetical protein
MSGPRRSPAGRRLLPALALLALAALGAGSPAAEEPAGSLFRRVDFGELPDVGKSFGATWADVDQDGRLDFLLLRHGDGVGVYLARAGLHFARRDSCPILPCHVVDQHGTAACDHDGDGDWDLYATVGADRGHGEGPNELWSWIDAGRLIDLLPADHMLRNPLGRGRGALWVCLDADRYPELLVLNYMTRARLFSFDGASWTDWSGRIARKRLRKEPRINWFAFGVAADFDGDDRPELFLHGSVRRLLRNRGEGRLEEVTQEAGLAMHGPELAQAAAGDVDNDGDLDLLLARRRPAMLELWLNESAPGRLRFAPGPDLRELPLAFETDIPVLADFDNDGILDLYITQQRGDINNAANLVARGRGDGTFEDVTDQWGGRGAVESLPRGAWPVDLDRDGDLDLMLVHGKGHIAERRGLTVLYENTTARRGLTLELVASGGAPHGLGARVALHTRQGVQVRQVRSVIRHFSSTVLPVHFGLGDDPGPYRVVIRWPGGVEQEIELPRGGCAYVLREGEERARILADGD